VKIGLSSARENEIGGISENARLSEGFERKISHQLCQNLIKYCRTRSQITKYKNFQI